MNRIVDFEEKPESPKNARGYRPLLLPPCLRSDGQTVCRRRKQHDQPGRLVQWLYLKQPSAWSFPGLWFDIGSKETLEEANRIFADKTTTRHFMASEPATIIAFYHPISRNSETRSLLAFCKQQKIFGSILLAQEGINGTVAGSKEAIDNLLDRLRSDGRLAALEQVRPPSRPFLNEGSAQKEIVTLRQPDGIPLGTWVNMSTPKIGTS